jgi:biopolymer transport protein ExbB
MNLMDLQTFETLFAKAQTMFLRAWEIQQAGGWAMWPIGLTALALFYTGWNVYLKLRATGFEFVPEKKWRRWLDEPENRRGPIGRMINFVEGAHTLEENAVFFQELRVVEIAPYNRDLKVIKVCISAAPLFGLLGTVTGMLATFYALATGSGGEKTMGMIAAGISEALITTEAGLIVALPGLFFHYQLKRKHERYNAFLAHMETVCGQRLYHKLRNAQKSAA